MKSLFNKKPLHVCLIMALTLSLTAGCAVFRAYWEWSSYYEKVSEDRIFPKKPRFSISPESTDVSHLIDYNGVYYIWDISKPVAYCPYMRFWPSGEVYGSFVYGRLPDLHDADSVDGIRMGFYCLEGTNICIELYLPNCYTLSRGFVIGDNIVLNWHMGRSDSGYIDSSDWVTNSFSFLPIQGMKRQPDWSPTGMLHRVEFSPTNHP